jgi:hypothetical protein
MHPMLDIAPLLDLPAGIEELRAEAAGEGFRFMDKFIAEWRAGTNRFARPGEVAAWCLPSSQAAKLVGVGSLHRDPYTDQEGDRSLAAHYVRFGFQPVQHEAAIHVRSLQQW